MAVGIAHDVEAADRGPHAVGGRDAAHRGLEALRGVEHARGHHALRDDPPLAVDVGHERVERAHALAEAGRERLPLVRRGSRAARDRRARCRRRRPTRSGCRARAALPRSSRPRTPGSRERTSAMTSRGVWSHGAIRCERVVVGGRAVLGYRGCGHGRRLPRRSPPATLHPMDHGPTRRRLRHRRRLRGGTGAERVVLLLDAGDPSAPVLVEHDGRRGRGHGRGDGRSRSIPDWQAQPLALPEPARGPRERDHAPTPSRASSPRRSGSIQLLADSVLALARAVGGRSVATATFPTADPATPLTLAARDGEDVVLELAGRHFSLPAA